MKQVHNILLVFALSGIGGTVWASDLGKFLVSGSTKDGWEIFIVNGDGSGQRQLTQTGGKAIDPKWSPDGINFAYHKGDGLGLGNDMGKDLGTINVKKTKINGFDWSADGKKLYYAACGYGHCRIYERDMDSGKEKIVLENDLAMIPVVACSPDGRMMAYVADDDSSMTDQAVVVNLETGKEIVRSKLTAHNSELDPNRGEGYLQAFILELNWTSNSKTIYFERLGNTYQTYFLDVESGKTREWPEKGEEEMTVDSENSTVYFNDSFQPGVYRAELNGRHRDRLTETGCWSGDPQVICTGKKIAFQSNCDMDIDHLGKSSLYIMDLNGTAKKRVTMMILDGHKSTYSWHK